MFAQVAAIDIFFDFSTLSQKVTDILMFVPQIRPLADNVHYKYILTYLLLLLTIIITLILTPTVRLWIDVCHSGLLHFIQTSFVMSFSLVRLWCIRKVGYTDKRIHTPRRKHHLISCKLTAVNGGITTIRYDRRVYRGVNSWVWSAWIAVQMRRVKMWIVLQSSMSPCDWRRLLITWHGW